MLSNHSWAIEMILRQTTTRRCALHYQTQALPFQYVKQRPDVVSYITRHKHCPFNTSNNDQTLCVTFPDTSTALSIRQTTTRLCALHFQTQALPCQYVKQRPDVVRYLARHKHCPVNTSNNDQTLCLTLPDTSTALLIRQTTTRRCSLQCFNVFNIPIIFEHLIEIVLYDSPSLDFLVLSHLRD